MKEKSRQVLEYLKDVFTEYENSENNLLASNQQLQASEQQLQASNQQLLEQTQELSRMATVVKDSNDAVLIQDLEGNISAWNAGATKMYGYSDKEALKMNVADLVPVAYKAEALDFIVNLKGGELVESLETKRQTKDGKTLDVWMVVTRLVDEDGKLIGAATTERDITERKQAELALREKSIMLDNILNNSIDTAIAMTDLDFRITYYNPLAEKYFGYSANEVFGKTVQDMHTKEKVAPSRFEQAIRKVKESGEYIYTVDQQTPEGIRHLKSRVSGILDSEGKLNGFVLFTHDITREKIATQILEESEERFRSLYNNSTIGLYRTTPEGNILLANPTLVNMLGYSSFDEFKTRNLKEEGFESVLSRKDFIKDLDRAGEIKGYEAVWMKLDGTKINIRESAKIILDKKGTAKHYDGSVEDITDYKNVEKQREQALQDARNANAVKDLFLANMSHELRTPLNSLLGFVEIAEDSIKDRINEEESEYFQIIRHSGKRLIKTVHGILDISQIESGTILFSREIMPLAPTVELIYKEFKLQADAKKLKMTFENHIADGCIKADKSLLLKAVSNIVENAIKYTDKGEIALKLIERVGHYGLSISDTGIGMSADYMKHMYDTFTQESSGFTKKYQGLGLGLSIAKSCLELMEIDIDVESKKGVGTIFRLTFTREEGVDDKPVKAIPKVGEAIDIEKPMVLIVEDDEDNRKVLEMQLKPTYQTCYSVSVDSAKRQLDDQDVDLVLLDLALEDEKNGLDLVAYMKTKDDLKDIPIIAITAYAFNVDRENALNAGCDDYMSKPINLKKLLGMINEYCNKK